VANGQRKKIGAIRATGAVALASLGVFTAMAGLGFESWPLGAVGMAMLILAVALLLTSSFRGVDRAFVVGTAHVLEATEPPATLTHGRIEMHLQIEAPGHPPASVRVRDPRVPVAKWPNVGDVLPVRVSVDDIRRVRVLWDEILTHTQRFQDYADAEYEGLTDDEPLYDDRRPGQAHQMHFEEPAEEEPAEPQQQMAQDEGPEGPPLPHRRRPRPHRQDETPAAEPAGTPGSTQVLEGQIIEAPTEGPPLRVDVIDFSEAPASPQADVPPSPRTSPEEHSAYLSHAQEPIDPIPPYSRGGGASSVHGVGITLLVADIGRSVEFYRDLLGFDEIDSGRGNAVLASGDTRLVLRLAEDFTATNRRLTHINLEVDDLDAVYQDLVEKGIGFTYPPRVVNRGERLELWAAAFRDPDGHAVNLTQWRSRS
jgi:catechol 2,3-dioxygenase-like lactoylglutathione lyase family enzyme